MKRSVVFKSLVVASLLVVALFAVLALSSCSHTHSYTNMSVLQVPTCSEVGVQRAACECGDFQIVEMPKTEHTAGEWKPLYAESCITKGSKQLFCKVCNEVMKTETVPALGHDLVSYEKREPTCSVVGHEAYEACTRCTYSTYREIAKIAHTSDPNSQYPTCTEPLLCNVCGEVVKPAKGHTEIVTTGIVATCTKEGKTDYIECYACGVILQEAIKIPKRAHTIVELPALAPTCSAIGRTLGQQCSECGVSIITPIYVSAIPHTYSGKNATECSVCGEDRVNARCAHKNKEIFNKHSPTCTQFGVTKGEACSDCGEVLIKQNVIGKDGKTISNINDQTTGNLPNHTIEIIPATAPTPTMPGLSEGKRCSVCKLILVQQDVIPALSRTAKTE